jgi:ribosomal-protein-alanine N-acetyltransferase
VISEYPLNDDVFLDFPERSTARLQLRPISLNDIYNFYQLRSNPKVIEFMDTDPIKSLQDAEQKIRDSLDLYNNKMGITWTINGKAHGNFMGYCTFWRLDRKNARSELGYAMLPEFWGNGYMEEALRAVVEFAYEEWQLHSIEANVNPKNERSIVLLNKLGFRQEGYFQENFRYNGEFLDSAIYSLLKSWYS